MGFHPVMQKVKNWRGKQYHSFALKPLSYELVDVWGTGGGFAAPGERRGNIFVSQGSMPNSKLQWCVQQEFKLQLKHC